MAVNSERIQKVLQTVAGFGAQADGSTTRLSYSREFRQAQEYLQQLMESIGMQTEIDAVGNLIGTYSGTDTSLPAVMSGSHLDTVPNGGNYDGILGIAAALEVAYSWHEEGFRPKRSLKVIATAEEEGTAFGMACFGVRARSGEFKELLPEQIKCTASAQTLRDLLGTDTGNALADGAVGFKDIKSFVELHIEQGAELDEQNLEAGIVTHIVGYDRLHLVITGEANHSGTTAMHRRKDAAAAGAEIILAVRDLAAADPRIVATVGKFSVEPNVPNIVPGKVRLCIETRSYANEILDEVGSKIEQLLEAIALKNAVVIERENKFRVDAVPLATAIINTMEECAVALGLQYRKLPSWAGHDAQILAAAVPTGMIFVPSVRGISHSKEEYSRPERIFAGTLLLEKVLRNLAQ